MWSYQKKLQYPVNIKNTNPKLTIIGTNLKKKDLLKTFE